jgi:hypothetical protein
MSCFPAEKIASTAEFLLHFLNQSPDGSAAYSLLYDGTDEQHGHLIGYCGFEDDYDSPELAIDLAAQQLAEAGFITIIPLDTELPDGEPDYLMRITEAGLAFVLSEKPFRARDVEL